MYRLMSVAGTRLLHTRMDGDRIVERLSEHPIFLMRLSNEYFLDVEDHSAPSTIMASINHACSSTNARYEKVAWEDRDSYGAGGSILHHCTVFDLHRAEKAGCFIAVFATKSIRPGDEILVNYKWDANSTRFALCLCTF